MGPAPNKPLTSNSPSTTPPPPKRPASRRVRAWIGGALSLSLAVLSRLLWLLLGLVCGVGGAILALAATPFATAAILIWLVRTQIQAASRTTQAWRSR